MILEQAVEGTKLTGANKKPTPKSAVSSPLQKEGSDTKEELLQELLLQITASEEEPEIHLKEEKTEKKESEEENDTKEDKTLSEITEDTEVSDEDENNVDEVHTSYDAKEDELIHKKQYEQQLQQYAKFLSSYLKGTRYRQLKPDTSVYNNGGKKQLEVRTSEVSMITYHEKVEHVRAFVMNKMTGGVSKGGFTSGGNQVNPDLGNSYELWRVFQHNQILSFMYTSEWMH
jgi:hypothetical protein